jgi:hypothetical protein
MPRPKRVSTKGLPRKAITAYVHPDIHTLFNSYCWENQLAKSEVIEKLIDALLKEKKFEPKPGSPLW